jgi:hypothetical protein
LDDPVRVKRLTIDPGPRAIKGANAAEVRFDRKTPASYFDSAKGEIVQLPTYPKSFPRDSFKDTDAPAGAIDTLGELLTDGDGRLLVIGGYGRAVGWKLNGAAPLPDDVNNDQWFDDSSDGPVTATIVFDDDSRAEVQHAWVTATDPSTAPQIRNIVTLWDDIFDCWVRKLDLVPTLYGSDSGKPADFLTGYQPSFQDDLGPLFQTVALQQWIANLSPNGISAHKRVGGIKATDDPSATDLDGLVAIFRNPFKTGDDLAKEQSNTSLMPLALGDAGDSFLTLRKTQYFMLQRWNEGRESFKPGPGPLLGPGEYLDKATLVNCLGGRFSPGIDLTFVVREPALYVQPWQSSGHGPFRIARKALDYGGSLTATKPLLTGGYVPHHVEADGLEPGDLSKWMSLPWHTDYNSCSTHPPSPNPKGNRKVFWSWPAQRPVAVYAATDVSFGADFSGTPVALLGAQRWSLRGEGTDSDKPENWGRYQSRPDVLENWHRIGVVVQASAVDNSAITLPEDWFLEVESQLLDTGLTPVVPFPNFASEPGDVTSIDPRDLYFKLLNVDNHPEVIPDARSYVEYWLAQAEQLSRPTDDNPVDQHYFPYTYQAFRDRLEMMYQEVVDDIDNSSPATDKLIRTRADAIMRIHQMAAFNLLDGGWLRNIGRVGPIDEVRSILFSVWMDEVGDGDVSMNHCNIYRDLCHSVGYYPPPIETRDFAYDPDRLDSAYSVPAFELAISQFTEDYYPELIGMTLQLEWGVIDSKHTRDLMDYFNINSHYYVLHIGIDNAVNGHGQRAAEAVELYLEQMRLTGGEPAVQAGWRRIWNGFVAFGNVGTFGEDFKQLLLSPPSLRHQMIQLIERKADFGRRNHEKRTVGACRINEWFADPPGFLDALQSAGYLLPGNWAGSRFRTLLNFDTGPMFRVFTDDEIALWEAYTLSLGAPPPPHPGHDSSPARDMAAVIDKLRPAQQDADGHKQNMLSDHDGTLRPLAWWFAQPGDEGTRNLMAALASPANDVITPGDPDNSRFFTEFVAPGRPMGSWFDQPAPAPATGSCRDVVSAWITAKCPLLAKELMSLMLNSPAAKHENHPTGRIRGMGTVH